MKRLVVAAVAVASAHAAVAFAQAGPPGLQPAAPPPASAPLPRHGFTAEANLGIGVAYLLGGGVAGASDVSLAGLDLGVGGWLTPSLALTFRVSGMSVGQSDTSDALTQEFIGASLQRWLTRHVWVSGGLGLAVLHDGSCGIADFSSSCATAGFGVDGRVGYSWLWGDQSINVSLEVTPGIYVSDGDGGVVTSFALLFGYQYL